MQFGKIMAVYSEKSMGHRNTLCGKITGSYNIKANCRQSYHCTLKGYVNRKTNIRGSHSIDFED
jgi:hypothetical protein